MAALGSWKQASRSTRAAHARAHPPSVRGKRGVLLAYGYWGWALLTLAGAVANIVWAYRVYRATMR